MRQGFIMLPIQIAAVRVADIPPAGRRDWHGIGQFDAYVGPFRFRNCALVRLPNGTIDIRTFASGGGITIKHGPERAELVRAVEHALAVLQAAPAQPTSPVKFGVAA